MSIFFSVLGIVLSLLLAPLLPGLANRVKAAAAGRKGIPLLQLYYDLAKLAKKRPVYSRTVSALFALGPAISAACTVAALLLCPFAGVPALLFFPGDFFLLAGALTLGRFAMVLAALDTGSAFEGMGSAREAFFSAMAEPILLVCLAVLAYASDSMSLSGVFLSIGTGMEAAPLALDGLESLGAAAGSLSPAAPETAGNAGTALAHLWPFFVLSGLALFLLMLTECCRIPVDDPATHLELTMIHEAMVLDHSGPDLALIQYAAALKMWVFGLLMAGVFSPSFFSFLEPGSLPFLAACLAFSLVVPMLAATATGVVESAMARLKLERVPHMLTVAGAIVMLSALGVWR